MMKKKILAMTLSLGLMTSALTPFASAKTSELTDIQDHWAVNAIEWGIEKGAISGYEEDHTFRPENLITEAEFISMFIGLFHPLDKAEEGKLWSDPVYAFSAENNYPVLGQEDAEVRNQPILRSTVAEIIAAADGFHFVGDDAIEYLLLAEYSKGKTAATLEGFKGNDPLTRAEAVQFIKSLTEHEFTELYSRPAGVMSIDLLNFSDFFVPVAEEVKGLMPDYEYEILFDGVNYTKKGQDIASYIWYDWEYGMEDYIYFQKYSDADSRKFVIQLLTSLGVTVGSDFEQVMEKAYNEEDQVYETEDGYTLSIIQGYLVDELIIFID